jgi:hypothetical protein
MALSLDDPMVVSSDVLFRALDAEAVLLNLKSGVYFGLNPVGTRAWQLLAEHRTLGRVRDVMLDEYDVEREVLERDLLELGRQLQDAGLAAVTTGP